MHENYFNSKDLTHTFNVNKVLTKERRVVHSCAAHEISVLKILVLEILRICHCNTALLLNTKRWKKLCDFSKVL